MSIQKPTKHSLSSYATEWLKNNPGKPFDFDSVREEFERYDYDAELMNWATDPQTGIIDPYKLVDITDYPNTAKGRRQYEHDLAQAKHQSEMSKLHYETEFNSEQSKVDRMRDAGLNPDLLGIDGASTVETESAGAISPDMSGIPTLGQQIATIAEIGMSVLSTAIGSVGAVQQIKNLSLLNDHQALINKGQNLINIGLDFDNGIKELNLASSAAGFAQNAVDLVSTKSVDNPNVEDNVGSALTNETARKHYTRYSNMYRGSAPQKATKIQNDNAVTQAKLQTDALDVLGTQLKTEDVISKLDYSSAIAHPAYDVEANEINDKWFRYQRQLDQKLYELERDWHTMIAQYQKDYYGRMNTGLDGVSGGSLEADLSMMQTNWNKKLLQFEADVNTMNMDFIHNLGNWAEDKGFLAKSFYGMMTTRYRGSQFQIKAPLANFGVQGFKDGLGVAKSLL